jgi:hypothetical protein
MAAGKYDFTIEQGSSFKLSLIYKDSSEIPIDITSWCARLIWTTSKGIVQVFSTTNVDYTLYKFTITGAEGKLLLQFPASVTNNFLFDSAKYDLELESPSAMYTGGGKEIIRLIFGGVKIIRRNSDTLLSCQP